MRAIVQTAADKTRTQQTTSDADKPRSPISLLIVLLLAAASAGTAILALPGYELWFLTFVAWVPLFLLMRRVRPAVAVGATTLAGFLYFLGALYWFSMVTVLGWVALSFYFALHFSLFAVLCRWAMTGRPRVPFLLAAPVIWTAIEFLRSATWAGPDWFLITGCPWQLVAHPLYRQTLLIQVADFAGAYGVSFLVITVNAWLACLLNDLLTGAWKRPRKRIAHLLATVYVLGLLGGTAGYGWYRLAEYAPVDGPTVCVVQGNIAQELKEVARLSRMGPEDRRRESARQRREVIDAYMHLSRTAADAECDILVWPETSMPGPIEWLPESQRAVEELCRLSDSYVLIGASRVDASRTDFISYNSAYLYGPEGGEPLDIYDKLHPVPFGEYIPMVERFPWLKRFMPTGYRADVTPGSRTVLFTIPREAGGQWTFATPICVEDTMPYLIRRFRRHGADFIINLTNDGWFGDSFELDQHLAISVFRAVENRVALVRAANTGVSAFIEGNGRIASQLTNPEGKHRAVAGVLTSIVRVDRRQSPYCRQGDIFAFLCLGWTGLFLLLRGARILTPLEPKN